MRSKYENKLVNLRIEKEVELREARFHEVEALSSEHRIFHEREHAQYSDALRATAGTLGIRLDGVDTRISKLIEDQHSFLTIERFEREHGLLETRLDERWSTAQQQIANEENVTVKQTIRQQTLDEIASSTGVNRRWLIALVATGGLMLAGLILNIIIILFNQKAV